MYQRLSASTTYFVDFVGIAIIAIGKYGDLQIIPKQHQPLLLVMEFLFHWSAFLRQILLLVM